MCASNPRRRTRGISLIELMVGLVVALLIGLAALSIAMRFAASQRQAVGVGSALSNAASALDVLKGNALQAGLGFFGDSSYRCDKLNFSNGGTRLWDGSAFAPLQIARPSSGLFDTLDVVYATSVYGGAAVPVRTGSSTAVTVSSHLPATAGQALLLSAASTSSPCTVRTITNTVAATGSSYEQLRFESGGAYNQASFTTPVSYGDGARAALLGSLFAYRYGVSNGKLQQLNLIDGSVATLLRDVVAFRAQYGVSASADSTVLSQWVDPSGSWAAIDSSDIARVLGLRVQVLVRASQREKPDASTGLCQATTSAFQLSTGETVTLSEDDKCYRYRLISAVLPLRNTVTGLQ